MATIIVGTNSYVTVTELETYATDRGITIIADTTILLIKSMDYIETRQYKSVKTVADQALEFPRILCASGYNCEYDNETVPDDIKTAQIVGALYIDDGEELQPTLTQSIKSEKVDVLEIEYQDNTSASSTFTKLNDLLRPFLSNTGLKTVRV